MNQYAINTTLQFPDGFCFDLHWSSGWQLASPTNIRFTFSSGPNGGGVYTYNAPTADYAQQVLRLLAAIPKSTGGGTYNIAQRLPLTPSNPGAAWVTLPDGNTLNLSMVVSFLIDPLGPGPQYVSFRLATGATQLYQAASATQAQLTLLALDRIEVQPPGLYYLAQFMPTFAVLNLTPNNGPAAGGTVITVDGIGFVNGCVSNLDGKAVPVNFISATQITITSASSIAGTVSNLIVSNPDGTQAIAGQVFTWT